MTALAILCDYREEVWPSMDLCAEAIVRGLAAAPGLGLTPVQVLPPFRRRFGVLPGGRASALRNADRLLNRMWDYPRHARRMAPSCELFHVADHSYAHLVLALPAARTGVYCHDLDTFRCLLAPQLEPRPAWFRAMARHILTGLQQAAIVFYGTEAVRAQIEQAGLVRPERLVHAPLGIDPELTRATAAAQLPPAVRRPFLLHVGSCIARKRVDLAIDALAAARARRPDLLLVQVGGTFTAAHRAQLARLGLADAAVQLRGLATAALGELYRQTELVLQPSDAEGFGLPVAEALACGAPVLASDIPALREVAGGAALFAPAGDGRAFAQLAVEVVSGRISPPPRDRRLAQGSRFSWEAHVRTIAAAYLGLADGAPAPRAVVA